MTFKYRDHRGSLDASMATEQELPDFAALFAYLRDDLAHYGFTLAPEMISIEPYGPDDRIGWTDQHIVSVAGVGVVGYTNGLIDHQS